MQIQLEVCSGVIVVTLAESGAKVTIVTGLGSLRTIARAPYGCSRKLATRIGS